MDHDAYMIDPEGHKPDQTSPTITRRDPMMGPGLISNNQATTGAIPSLMRAAPAAIDDLETVSQNELWTDEVLLRTALYAWRDVEQFAGFSGTLRAFREILDGLEAKYGSNAFVSLHNDGDYTSRFRAATRDSLIAQAVKYRETVAKHEASNEVRERQELARLKAKYGE